MLLFSLSNTITSYGDRYPEGRTQESNSRSITVPGRSHVRWSRTGLHVDPNRSIIPDVVYLYMSCVANTCVRLRHRIGRPHVPPDGWTQAYVTGRQGAGWPRCAALTLNTAGAAPTTPGSSHVRRLTHGSRA